eukprot:15271280-Alexandrium_andersonii.AAC.1
MLRRLVCDAEAERRASFLAEPALVRKHQRNVQAQPASALMCLLGSAFSRAPACNDFIKAALSIMGDGHLSSPLRRKLQIALHEPAKAEDLNE